MIGPGFAIASIVCALQPAPAAPPEAFDARSQVQAAEATLAALGADASDSAVLVGVPTEAQRARVRADATEALGACIRAAEALTRAVAAVEAHPDFFDDPSLRDLRSELAVEYAEFRLPMARARAALLLAAADPGHRRAPDLLRVAADSVQAMDVRTPALAVRRYVILALSGAQGGPVDDALLTRASEQAHAQAPGLAQSDPQTAVEAILQRAIVQARRGRFEDARAALSSAAGAAPFVRPDGAHEPAWRLLLADATFRVNLRASERDSGQLAQVSLRRAWSAYESLLRDDQLPLTLAQRRAIAVARLQSALPPDARAESLPHIAVLALADRRAGESGYGDDAIRMLALAVENRPVDDPFMRAELRYALASQLLARAEADPAQSYADRRRAMTLLTAIGAESGDWPDARIAMEGACRIAVSLPPGVDEDQAAIESALRVAVEQYDDLASINRWRLALARRTANEAERVTLLEAVPEGSPERATARARLLSITMARLRAAEETDRSAPAQRALAIASEVRHAATHTAISAATRDALLLRTNVQAIEAHLALHDIEGAMALAPLVANAPNADRWLAPLSDTLERQMRSAAPERVIAIAEMLVETSQNRLRSDPPESRARDIRATLARALVASGRPDQAAPILDELRTAIGPRLDILRAGAEAAYALGDDAKAFGLYRQIVTPLENADNYSDDYWLCWSRMLQILARQNEDGARSRDIRREIRRLRVIDASLGGESYASRIEAVESSLGAD